MERIYKVVYSVESVDLTLLAQAFAKQFLKDVSKQQLAEKNVVEKDGLNE
jgi:hypothetical protein